MSGKNNKKLLFGALSAVVASVAAGVLVKSNINKKLESMKEDKEKVKPKEKKSKNVYYTVHLEDIYSPYEDKTFSEDDMTAAYCADPGRAAESSHGECRKLPLPARIPRRWTPAQPASPAWSVPGHVADPGRTGTRPRGSCSRPVPVPASHPPGGRPRRRDLSPRHRRMVCRPHAVVGVRASPTASAPAGWPEQAAPGPDATRGRAARKR